MDFKSELDNRIKYVESIINSLLPKEMTNDKQNEIYEAMAYSVTAGGKRLRPILMLEMNRFFGGNDEDVKYFLAVIEFIHTYSLVHDDLPAMDNDDFRRGKLTTHKKYGEAMGILTGDALLNYAFEMGMKGIWELDCSKKAVKALIILSKCAGVYGMIGGQVVDIKNDDKKIDIDTLDYINELKTSALIEGSMMVGAVLAGANNEELEIIKSAASDIGRAFQIQDDILDVTGVSETLGKPVHSDEKNNKSTYCTILGVDKAREIVKELTDTAIQKLKSLERENEFLFELIYSLIYRKN